MDTVSYELYVSKLVIYKEDFPYNEDYELHADGAEILRKLIKKNIIPRIGEKLSFIETENYKCVVDDIQYDYDDSTNNIKVKFYASERSK